MTFGQWLGSGILALFASMFLFAIFRYSGGGLPDPKGNEQGSPDLTGGFDHGGEGGGGET